MLPENYLNPEKYIKRSDLKPSGVRNRWNLQELELGEEIFFVSDNPMPAIQAVSNYTRSKKRMKHAPRRFTCQKMVLSSTGEEGVLVKRVE